MRIKTNSGRMVALYHASFETVKILFPCVLMKTHPILGLRTMFPKTQRKRSRMLKNFRQKCRFLVDGITKLSKVYYRHDMAERQIESLKNFSSTRKGSACYLIKLADRLTICALFNMCVRTRDIGLRRKRWKFMSLSPIFGIKELRSELEDLCFTICTQRISGNLQKIKNQKLN